MYITLSFSSSLHTLSLNTRYSRLSRSSLRFWVYPIPPINISERRREIVYTRLLKVQICIPLESLSQVCLRRLCRLLTSPFLCHTLPLIISQLVALIQSAGLPISIILPRTHSLRSSSPRWSYTSYSLLI